MAEVVGEYWHGALANLTTLFRLDLMLICRVVKRERG